MKKKILLIIVLTLVVLTTGCGKKKETVICKVDTIDEISGYEFFAEHKIVYSNEIVSEITTTETMIYNDDAYNETAVKEAKNSFMDFYKAQDNVYGGFKNETKIDGKKVISTTTFDFEKINKEKFLADNVMLKEYANDKQEIKVDGFIEMYKSLGATCEKD